MREVSGVFVQSCDAEALHASRLSPPLPATVPYSLLRFRLSSPLYNPLAHMSRNETARKPYTVSHLCPCLSLDTSAHRVFLSAQTRDRRRMTRGAGCTTRRPAVLESAALLLTLLPLALPRPLLANRRGCKSRTSTMRLCPRISPCVVFPPSPSITLLTSVPCYCRPSLDKSARL